MILSCRVRWNKRDILLSLFRTIDKVWYFTDYSNLAKIMRHLCFTPLVFSFLTFALSQVDGICNAQPLSARNPQAAIYNANNYDLPHAHPRETPIERYRRSFCQGAEIRGGYLLDLGDAEGGMNQAFEEVRADFGIPLGSMDNLIGLRPYFRADQLQGLDSVDVPGVLYNTGLNILHQRKWNPLLSSTVVVTPSIRSDFTTSDDAFRVFGLALMNWKCRRDLTVSLGAVYFDRADFNLLPAFGFVWTPTPEWKIDATMPRPRLSHRLWKAGGEAEGWAYLGGSIGGNTWAVTRASGETDELTIRDFRLMGGYEVLEKGNRGHFVEAGLALGRTLEYEQTDIELELDAGFYLDAGIKF